MISQFETTIDAISYLYCLQSEDPTPGYTIVWVNGVSEPYTTTTNDGVTHTVVDLYFTDTLASCTDPDALRWFNRRQMYIDTPDDRRRNLTMKTCGALDMSAKSICRGAFREDDLVDLIYGWGFMCAHDEFDSYSYLTEAPWMLIGLPIEVMYEEKMINGHVNRVVTHTKSLSGYYETLPYKIIPRGMTVSSPEGTKNIASGAEFNYDGKGKTLWEFLKKHTPKGIINVDRFQKKGKHDVKHELLRKFGWILNEEAIIEEGDYTSEVRPNFSIDTKSGLGELSMNVLDPVDAPRFRRELDRAVKKREHLVILTVLDEDYTTWVHPKCKYCYRKCQENCQLEPERPHYPNGEEVLRAAWDIESEYLCYRDKEGKPYIQFLFVPSEESAAAFINDVFTHGIISEQY